MIMERSEWKDGKEKNEYTITEYRKNKEKAKYQNTFCSNLSVKEFSKYNIRNINLRYYFQKMVSICKVKKNIRIDNFFPNDNKISYNKFKVDDTRLSYHNDKIISYYKSIEVFCKNMKLENVENIYTTKPKLIVGIGNTSVIETSMTLHHVYGIPYIPAQGIKGVFRNYFLEKYFDFEKDNFKVAELEGVKEEICYEKLYKYIFGDDFWGDDSEKGNVIFFDVFPVSDIIIEKDVMTPHYRDYYENRSKELSKYKAPLDDSEPNPIFFHTVKETEFKFIFALNKKDLCVNKERKEIKIEYENIKKFIEKIFEDAIQNHGMGAKTAVGYGYFECKDNKKKEDIISEDEILKNKMEALRNMYKKIK